MKIKITAIWELDEDLNTWPPNEQSFDKIKEYIENDSSYFLEIDPKSILIEKMR